MSTHSDIIIFIGGLHDGLLTSPFVLSLKDVLPSSYSPVEILLSSSYAGWGTSSLDEDVSEIAQCVQYFRDLHPNGKIVLMGHSTGSQDVIHYLVSGVQTPKIDGGILLSGISDREAFAVNLSSSAYDHSVRVAREYIDEGRGRDCLPSSITGSIFPGPVSAKRWFSLMSPGPDHAGEDDYFSSDFDDRRLRGTFGKIGGTGTPLSILFGGSDEHVPDSVDKAKLVSRWIKTIEDGGGLVDEDSGVISEATHTLNEVGKPLEERLSRITGFLRRISKR